MIQLKEYQHRVLDSLRKFLRECSRVGHPETPFRDVTAEVYGQPSPYISIRDPRFAAMPYVCVRVPTGGGKTLLASHTVGIALNELLPVEQAVALWLVPSNTILDQTADALRNPRHPYRRALEMECGGPVEVLTIEEALRMSRAMVAGQTVVIVSTIQCFRVADQTGRKVYDGGNAYMAEHMADVPPDRYPELDMGPDGKPRPSLMNVLRYRRPIVLVDEAHNARTELSFATLANVLPSCVIEFTATPDTKKNPSNVLHRVSAAELKAENMIKLPLRVITRDAGQKDQLLSEAITLRADLQRFAEKEAQATGEYIRPILLIQAERVDECEALRNRLVTDFGLKMEEIKISTGKLDELQKVDDIAAPGCNVRCIITVQKLREGWDCPFAYVLCSLRETHSATAIEQIVGRILRLPNAQEKQHADLNCAYVLSVSRDNRLEEVLRELREALESNGFTASEAERIILPVTQPLLPLGVQPQTTQLAPDAFSSDALRAVVQKLSGKVHIDADKGTVTVLVPLSKDDEDALQACVHSSEGREALSAAAERVRQAEKAFGGGAPREASPFERQMDFFVPLLAIREEDQHIEFERTHLIEHPWKLSAKDAGLPASYNPNKRPVGRQGIVDIGGKGEVTYGPAREAPDADFVSRLHQQVMQFASDCDWTVEQLVAWIDRHLQQRADIPTAESSEFIRQVIRGVMAKYGITDVSTLALDRFRLRNEIDRRINQHRLAEHKQVFQALLLPDSSLAVSDACGIDFRTMTYAPSWEYDGGFQFKKHYFGPRPGELREGTEEFYCAQLLDGLDEIEFWVRNLVRKPGSFRLQTSKDWFYPDFVCKLKDGRALVVEYKGGDSTTGWYAMPDSEEKRSVGAVWESRSNGRCLFIMPRGQDWEAIRRKISP